MTEEWHSDIEITEAMVRACIEAQFPALRPISEITYLSEGWDNKVFLVNKKTIFRFPRRAVAAELIAQENLVLNKLPEFQAIKIPRPNYLGWPTPQYPYTFQGYTLLNGKPSYQAQLSMADRKASVKILAEFLKQLHAIDAERALTLGAAPQVWDRTDANHAVTTLTERINKIVERQFCAINQNLLQQEFSNAQKLSLPVQDKCLVHGDLDSRHLLFNHGVLSGIIDWGDCGINNRSVDLAVVWDFYPAECHADFLNCYGAVDAATWQYARFLGLYSAFTLLLYGHSIGDQLLASESLEAVKRINPLLIL